MKVVVVGLGVQGYKRKEHAGLDYVCSVDPKNPQADYKKLEDVSLDTYDAVLACIPDDPKFNILNFCISNRKHVLIEKPLWVEKDDMILDLETLALKNKVLVYTAYNHQFEPHFVRMKNLIESGDLGKIYSCRMFYGNGTAKLVRDSVWRDQGAGVLPDLGSHLLDTVRFWFGEIGNFHLVSTNRFENQAPDHVVIHSDNSNPRIELEMTLCMWRNHFTCDILAEKGTAHIESLCKWGPSVFIHRNRIMPSGRPTEIQEVLVQPDPTWKIEYEYFKNLVVNKENTNLKKDYFLQTEIRRLSKGI